METITHYQVLDDAARWHTIPMKHIKSMTIDYQTEDRAEVTISYTPSEAPNTLIIASVSGARGKMLVQVISNTQEK